MGAKRNFCQFFANEHISSLNKTPTSLINKGKQGPCTLAVTVGFEPTSGSHLNNISSVAPSAARTRHQRVNLTGSKPNNKNEPRRAFMNRAG